MKNASCILTLALLLATPSLVWAQPAPAETPAAKVPSQADLRNARAAYQRGSAHQASGEYEQAILAYEDAYLLSQSPALWFNIGQAYRLWGHRKEALDHYRRYLQAEPEGQAAPEAYGHIQALEAQLKTEAEAEERARAEERAQGAQAEAERLNAEQKKDEQIRQARAAELTRLDAVQANKARKFRNAGWMTAAGGTVVGLVGVVFQVKAGNAEDTIAAAEGQWTVQLDQVVRDGEAAERKAILFYSLGGAVMTTGAALYLYGHYLKPQRRDAAISVGPILSSGTAGAFVRTSF